MKLALNLDWYHVLTPNVTCGFLHGTVDIEIYFMTKSLQNHSAALKKNKNPTNTKKQENYV